ncbi:MAG: YeeE/YedE family protein [Burkholderiales bacterium]|nr:YeeE/YedE family protein [Burkholderiales bacterium]
MKSGARIQGGVVLSAAAGLVALVAAGSLAGSPRVAALAAVGFLAGVALYHASFGFTSAWRRLILERRSAGVRAQIVMLAATVTVNFPLLAAGEAGALDVSGFVNPVGLALGAGAFLFGIGMQLGGGCGSGTLYTVGGGSVRMVVTLAAFILGSVFATADPLGWMSWPALPPVSVIHAAGLPAALLIAALLLATAYAAARTVETRAHRGTEPLMQPTAGTTLAGPWPLLAGALALAAVNIATLLLAGRPWGITAAFALWGAKAAAVAGVDVASWPYWRGDAALTQSVFADITSVMNFGIMLGALAAAGLAGRFSPRQPLPTRSLIAAVLGGLAMGVGARLATGCNIGAFFSGTMSGSLHGPVWLVFAIAGNWVGVKLRPSFNLPH